MGRLKQLEPDHPQLQRVGAEIDPGTVKVDHMFPMRSLNKGTNDEDIAHFVKESSLESTRFISQPKLDGSALSLEYRKGRLVRAATEAVATEVKTLPRMRARLRMCRIRLARKLMFTSEAKS